ncbi:MAG: class I SAM-dependent methyltransferase [Promethearchaeota archaeon]
MKYTREAYSMLPKRDNPKILDIGCGTGIPTIELAKISGGDIVAIDIDQNALDVLSKRVEDLGLKDRIKVLNRSLLDIRFSIERFDIIWAEGVIQFIGFEKALQKWYELLKINGNLVIHDDLGGMEKKLKSIPKCGFELIKYIKLPDDAWGVDYFEPLEKRINELSIKYGNNSTFLEEIKSYQNEIDNYKANPELFRSIFYILKEVIIID